MPDRKLSSLSSDFYPRACEWLALCCGDGVAVMIVQTGRTIEEHKVNLANGTSSTSLSLHLPRSMRWDHALAILKPEDEDKADAMDIAPYDQYSLHGPDKLKWDTKDPAWGIIARNAERVGLRSGGRWLNPFDPGHGEFVLPWKVKYLASERARPWPFRAAA